MVRPQGAAPHRHPHDRLVVLGQIGPDGERRLGLGGLSLQPQRLAQQEVTRPGQVLQRCPCQLAGPLERQ